MLGNVKSRMLPRHGILGVRASGGSHLVERGDAVARLELVHVLADLVHDPGDVVPLVQRRAHPEGQLPILRIRAAHDDLDDDLVGFCLGDRRVDDLDRRSCALENINNLSFSLCLFLSRIGSLRLLPLYAPMEM